MELQPFNVIDFITHVGIPTTITAVLLYGGWKGFVWTGANVIIPVRDRHFRFLDTLENTLRVITAAQENLNRQMDAISSVITAPQWGKCKSCPEESDN